MSKPHRLCHRPTCTRMVVETRAQTRRRQRDEPCDQDAPEPGTPVFAEETPAKRAHTDSSQQPTLRPAVRVLARGLVLACALATVYLTAKTICHVYV